jgi:ACS family hexuronate transporter-like MFS transporter
MGNSLLQSGAAVGAFLTPLIVLGLLGWTGSWRSPFLVVGAFGLGWVVCWLLLVRSRDLPSPRSLPPPEANGHHPAGARTWPAGWQVRRFCALVLVVVSINASWHYFRAWMPLFLQEQYHYTESQTGWFTSAYYIAADLGSLFAGFTTLWLIRRGLPVHFSRMAVFLFCSLLTSLSVVAALVAPGPLLLGLLLVIAFGALGVFPNYYSFSQELTVRHQGKVTGVLGASCWLSMAAVHEVVGSNVESTGSYSQGIALAGLAPLVGFAALVVLWGRTPRLAVSAATAAAPEPATLEPQLGEAVAIKPA